MKKEQQTMVVSPMAGEITSEKTLGINDKEIIEAEVIEDEDWGDKHPNFIESNTQAITLEELTNKNIIPTFCDNTLTISHQNFIGSVVEVAKIFKLLTLLERNKKISVGERRLLHSTKQILQSEVMLIRDIDAQEAGNWLEACCQ